MGLGDPGVSMPLIDLSTYVGEIPKGWQIVMIQSERGEMWLPTPVSDVETFINKFGDSVLWGHDPLWCIKALENGAKLIVVRIGHCTDISDRTTLTWSAAYCNVPDRGATPLSGSVTSSSGPFLFTQARGGLATGNEVGPYLIVLDTNDTFKVKVGSAAAETVTLTAGAARTAEQIVDELNAGTTGLTASVTDEGTIQLLAVADASAIEIMSVAEDAYSALGFQEGVFPVVSGTQSLVVEINAGSPQTFTLEPASGETGDFLLTNAQVASQLSGLTGGTVTAYQGKVLITSSTVGDDSSVKVTSASTADTSLGFDNTLHSGWEGTAVNAWKFVLTGAGAYGNGAKVYWYDNKLNSGSAMDFRLTIPGSPQVFYSGLVNDSNDPKYWKTYINTHCSQGQIVDLATPNPSPADWPAINESGITLTGGADGTYTLTDSDYVGNASAKTGLYCTEATTMPAIDIWCPGTTSAVVHTACFEFVDNRSGRFYIGATPQDMDVADTIDYRMGNPPDYSHAAFDTCSGALLYGEYQVLDTKFNMKRWIPATYQLAAAISRTDKTQGVAISPFGPKRGRCSGVLGVKNNVMPGSADADLLAEYGVNSARIILTSVETRTQEGAVLWGGWTMQRADSALKEFPISRKIKEYEHTLLPVMLGWINDPNHPVTWGEVHRTIEPYFRRDLERYHIYGYFVQTDKDAFFAGGDLKGAVLNMPNDIDDGKYRMRILIKPTRQIFYFIAEMGVMRTGDPFSDYAYMYTLPGWVRK